jgi:hypothetical protein
MLHRNWHKRKSKHEPGELMPQRKAPYQAPQQAALAFKEVEKVTCQADINIFFAKMYQCLPFINNPNKQTTINVLKFISIKWLFYPDAP